MKCKGLKRADFDAVDGENDSMFGDADGEHDSVFGDACLVGEM